jgi:hypothetical protein
MTDLIAPFQEFLHTQSSYVVLFLMIWYSILYFFKDSLNEVIKNISFNKKRKCSNLIYHDLFISLQDIKHKVGYIQFETHGNVDIMKNRILHHLLDVKIDRLKNELEALLQKDDIDALETQELKFELAKVSNRTSVESNKTVAEDLRVWGITEVDIKSILEGAEEFRTLLTQGLDERIESIITNKDYTSNYNKLSAILEVIAMSYYMMPKIIKDSFDQMNGRFAKYNKEHRDE